MTSKLLPFRNVAVVTVALALAVGAQPAHAAPSSYALAPIAFLGDSAAGNGTFQNDFEPGGLNNRGDMAFGADVGVGEGVFLLPHKGQIIDLGRSGETAPGGGTFAFGFLGPVALNDEGDVAFSFLLEPPDNPFGLNASTYRDPHEKKGTTTAVFEPGTTPAPGGGTFQGTVFSPSINNRGDIVFPGIIDTDHGVHVTGEAYIGLGLGVYRADKHGAITSIVIPGDAAPGGGTFDYATEPWINNGGDVSFVAHIAGDESVVAGFPPQEVLISALGGLYIKTAGKGQVRAIVSPGDPAPGGGNFRQVFHDVMNDRGDIAFFGDLTPAPGANEKIGVFLSSRGVVAAVARPGDAMPGGGHLVNASIVGGNVHINNRGDIAFSGVLDTVSDGFPDTGLYVWSRGRINVVARTGTVIPGVGTIKALASPSALVVPAPPIVTTTSGAINNERGQVLFQATLTDGRGVLLLATPHD